MEKARRIEFRQAAPRHGERLLALLEHQDGTQAQVDVTTLSPAEFAARATKWDSMGTSYRLKRQADPDAPSFLGGAMGLMLVVAVLVATAQGWGVTP